MVMYDVLGSFVMIMLDTFTVGLILKVSREPSIIPATTRRIAFGLDSDPNNMNFGLRVANAFRAQTYVACSDERIKSNIVDIHDTTALDQLRQLQPKYYKYVDKVGRGSSSSVSSHRRSRRLFHKPSPWLTGTFQTSTRRQMSLRTLLTSRTFIHPTLTPRATRSSCTREALNARSLPLWKSSTNTPSV